jgi:predicted TIM-barrel fold metal-dependent hydrolase
MAAEIDRIVDAHVHLWDPDRTDMYPYLSGLRDLKMGDISGWARYFDQKTYFAEAAKWNVQKFVHVAAGTDFVAETKEREAEADATGHPDAIIGGVSLRVPVAEAVEQLDAQMVASRFRGVRPMGGSTDVVPSPEVVAALQQRGLVLEMLARPDQIEGWAKALEGWSELTVVVEHAGWPHSGSDEEFPVWKAGISRLAALGPAVHCKLSGLSTGFGTVGVDAFKPWIEHCLDSFGVDRCFFASNVPPDGANGTFDDLYSTYSELTADLDAASREQLFASNAEQLYRC